MPELGAYGLPAVSAEPDYNKTQQAYQSASALTSDQLKNTPWGQSGFVFNDPESAERRGLASSVAGAYGGAASADPNSPGYRSAVKKVGDRLYLQVTLDSQGNPVGGINVLDNQGSFLGSALKTLGPIALSLVAPELAPFLSPGIAGAIEAGALTGAAGSALTGGNILQGALTGGVTGGLASQGGQISQALGGGPTGDALSKAIQGGAGTALRGGGLEDILRSGLISGGSQLGTDLIQSQNVTDPGTGLKYQVGGPGYQLGTGVPSNQGLSLDVPTGQGLVADVNTFLGPTLSQYNTGPRYVREGPGGGLIPAYQSASSLITPPSLADYSYDASGGEGGTGFSEPNYQQKQTSLATPGQNSALKQLLGYGINSLFGSSGAPSGGGVGGGGGGSRPPGGTVSDAGVTTGTTQGLGGLRAPGDLGSQETGKPRQNVWNEESLRLKDALGV